MQAAAVTWLEWRQAYSSVPAAPWKNWCEVLPSPTLLQGLSCSAIGAANMGPSLRSTVTPLMKVRCALRPADAPDVVGSPHAHKPASHALL